MGNKEMQSTGIRYRKGLIEFPVWYVRGGTSTGLIIREEDAPQSHQAREELLHLILGISSTEHLDHNRQLTGLGRGISTSNKVFFVKEIPSESGKVTLTSLFAQLSANSPEVDWSVNCGNMTSAIPLWAFDYGLLDSSEAHPVVDIINENTGVKITARLNYSPERGLKGVEIPGVHGKFPGVELFMHHPVGSKTGHLLPTGQVRDTINDIDVSCVDVAVPMVIIKAESVGKSGHEPIDDLAADKTLMDTLRDIRVEAGIRMGLKKNGTPLTREELIASKTMPKVCLVSSPTTKNSNITARYFTPQEGHPSMAVTGACCLAAACLIDKSVARDVATKVPLPDDETREYPIAIDNPAGVMDTIVVGHTVEDRFTIQSAAYNRSAQILMQGWVPLFQPSPLLLDELKLNIESNKDSPIPV